MIISGYLMMRDMLSKDILIFLVLMVGLLDMVLYCFIIMGILNKYNCLGFLKMVC